MIDAMDKLKKLIEQAMKSGYEQRSDLVVEINGGVVIYFLGDGECTASAALNYLEAL